MSGDSLDSQLDLTLVLLSRFFAPTLKYMQIYAIYICKEIYANSS